MHRRLTVCPDARCITIVHREEPWDTEGLIVKADIQKIEDLKGRTIATPRGSTSHFQLVYFLHLLKLTDSVTVRLAQPSELEGLWRAGTIDGAYVWSPHLVRLRTAFDAQTLLTGSAVSQLGAPTFDGYHFVIDAR